MFAGWEYPTQVGTRDDPRAWVAGFLELSPGDLGSDNELAGSLTIRSTFAIHIDPYRVDIPCRTNQRNRLTEEDAARAARSPVLLLGIPRKKRR